MADVSKTALEEAKRKAQEAALAIVDAQRAEIETTPFGASHHQWTNTETGETCQGKPIR